MIRSGGVATKVAAGWLALVIAAALFADVLPFVHPYDQRFPGQFRKGPSRAHWFGTNKVGFDVFSRTVHGARLSLLIAGAAILLGLSVASVIGMLAGYYRGRLDAVVTAVTDMVLSFPALVLALSVTTFLGHSATWIVLTLTVLSIPPLTKVVRAATMVQSNLDYVTAARALGATDRRILAREIFPNVVPRLVAFGLTGIGVLIVAEGALSFLGQSVPPPKPSWGGLIAEGRSSLSDSWWISVAPGVAMFLTISACNLIGDAVLRRNAARGSQL